MAQKNLKITFTVNHIKVEGDKPLIWDDCDAAINIEDQNEDGNTKPIANGDFSGYGPISNFVNDLKYYYIQGKFVPGDRTGLFELVAYLVTKEGESDQDYGKQKKYVKTVSEIVTKIIGSGENNDTISKLKAVQAALKLDEVESCKKYITDLNQILSNSDDAARGIITGTPVKTAPKSPNTNTTTPVAPAGSVSSVTTSSSGNNGFDSAPAIAAPFRPELNRSNAPRNDTPSSQLAQNNQGQSGRQRYHHSNYDSDDEIHASRLSPGQMRAAVTEKLVLGGTRRHLYKNKKGGYTRRHRFI